MSAEHAIIYEYYKGETAKMPENTALKACLDSSVAPNEVIQDSVMFRLIQISENSDRLTEDFKSLHSHIMWRAMKGMRNRIVHDYGEVDVGIVYRTVMNDIPVLHKQLSELLK